MPSMFLHTSRISASARNVIFRGPLSQNLTRSLASTASRRSAISSAIKQDHREIESYYQNILNAKNDDEATRWQNQFVWELARHSIAEELVVYPALERLLGSKGHDFAEKDRAEHQEVGFASCQQLISQFC